MAKAAYSIRSKEFGRGKAHVRRFTTLAGLQEAVKAQWQGVEYIDGPASFHSDYCTFTISGATLKDLGHRDPNDRWYWLWNDLTATPAPAPVQVSYDEATGDITERFVQDYAAGKVEIVDAEDEVPF